MKMLNKNCKYITDEYSFEDLKISKKLLYINI